MILNKNVKNKLPGSDIKYFREAVKISLALLKEVNNDFFLSPYSAVPLTSQILGLNSPDMGSGDSPYSLASIILQLRDKKSLFRQAFTIPMAEKREIIDEIYEMIAPSLLNEEDEYINFLIDTQYRPMLKNSRERTAEFKKNMKEKFSLLRPFINKFHGRQGDFGYIVHYGYPQDLYREYEFLRKLPESLSRKWSDYSYPIVNEITFENFSAGSAANKKIVRGWVIFISNYTRELLEDGRLRKRKILQAAKLAEVLGSKIIGMGGLIASFAQGGRWLSEQIPSAGFTTGHAYTIGNIIEIMNKAAEKVKLDINKAAVAVVGAAGSIGSGCAKLLAERNPGHITLIDLSIFSAQEKLAGLKNTIKKINAGIRVKVSTTLSDIKKADIVIIATDSPTSIIKPEHLKPGAVVVDDSFPKNISKELLRRRRDVVLLEGGVIQLPFSLNIFFARNMPDLLDAPLTRTISCKENYGCFAEILVLALQGWKKNYGLGDSRVQLAKDILKKAKEFGFTSAPLQCFDEAVEEERFARVAEVINKGR